MVRTIKIIEMANIPSTSVSIREVFIRILYMDIRSPPKTINIPPTKKRKVRFIKFLS